MALVSCERATPGPDQVVTGLIGKVTCERSQGRVACRGSNQWGLLGDGGVRPDSERLVGIAGPADVRAVAIAPPETFACALGREQVWCWGDGFVLGNSTRQPDAHLVTPTLIQGLPGIQQLAIGSAHACALDRDGTAWCWGDNIGGPIADVRNHRERRLPPTAIPRLAFRQLVAGGLQTCGVTHESDLYCWGGAVPSGDALVPALTPTRVLRGVARAFVSQRGEMCATVEGSGERCWSSVTLETNNAIERLRGTGLAEPGSAAPAR